MALTGNEIILALGVSPTGGLSSVEQPVTTQQIANLARGGAAPLAASAITSNATGLLGSMVAGGYVQRLLLRNTTANAVVVTVGTTSGGSDVAPNGQAGTLTVPANGTLIVEAAGFLKTWFSSTAAQAIWLASANWNGASVIARLDYEVGP